MRITGIINLHKSISLSTLTSRRAIASTNFLGRYSFIDFAISNFANSSINDIGILIKEQPRSLFRHLRLGDKEWGLNQKTGGISLMYNENYANNKMYNHDINNLIENKWFIKNSKADYFVIAPCHMIYRLDYREVVKKHISSNSDVTLIYKKVNDAKESFIGSDYLKIDEYGFVKSLVYNKGSDDERNIYMDAFVISKDKLVELINIGSEVSSFFSLKDTLNFICGKAKVSSFEYKGYLRCFDNIENYLKYSLELLNEDVSNSLFDKKWPVYTRSFDTPPVKYGKNSEIKSSYVANGSIINGCVENSIIGRDVVIEEGAVVKNSIILSHAVISKDSKLNHVVVDKEAKVSIIKELEGTPERPLVVKQEDIV